MSLSRGSVKFKALADVISQSGLSLVKIDIPELALRNIMSLLPEDHRGCGGSLC